VATIAWFVAGNPFGVDNAYVALAFPLIVMATSSLIAWMRGAVLLPKSGPDMR
jgi:solute:Na+ symporter, SSS family